MPNIKYTTLISIVIVTRNRKYQVIELLYDLKKLSYKNIEIIVVDNCSDDGTDEAVQETFPHIKVIKSKENLGAVGRNLGMVEAKGDYIVTIDDDVFFKDAGDIDKICSIFSERINVGVITFKVIHFESNNVINWDHAYDKKSFANTEFYTDSILEGASAFRKAVMEKAGYYPMSFFISHEGTDLACRIMNLGYNILFSPQIVVKHKVAEIGRKSWRRYYYDTRNHIWLAVRNYRYCYGIKYVFAKMIITFVYSAIDGYAAYWFKAIKDGIGGIPREWKNRAPVSKNTELRIKNIRKNKPTLIESVKMRLSGKRFEI